MIEINSNMKPIPLARALNSVAGHEWQPVTVDGSFNPSSQILLRNHYSEGVYGFELLTRFTTSDGKSFWVDCGWVKAGESATTQPELPELPTGDVSISLSGGRGEATPLPVLEFTFAQAVGRFALLHLCTARPLARCLTQN